MDKSRPDVKTQVKSIAEEFGVEASIAEQLAEKCYNDIIWRPYGGATSFEEIDQAQAAREYAYKIDDETYKLRAIVDNITYQDTTEMPLPDKVNSIKKAADEFGSRIDAIQLEPRDKSILEKLKNFILGATDESEKYIKKEGDSWVVYSSSGRRLGKHSTRKSALAQLRAIEANKKEIDAVAVANFKLYKEKGTGRLRWLATSSNAFEDLEKELFTTSALEEAVEYADKTGERGPLMFFHIPGTEIGQCDYQAVAGRMLIESGTFDNTKLAAKAVETLLSSDKTWQMSIGYKFIAGDEEDSDYEWLRFRERSICPPGTAANPYTDFKVTGEKDMNTFKMEQLAAFFGEDEAAKIAASAEARTKELEEQGVRFKEVKTFDAEAFAKDWAKSSGMDEEKALELARKMSEAGPATEEEKPNGAEGGAAQNPDPNENADAAQQGQEQSGTNGEDDDGEDEKTVTTMEAVKGLLLSIDEKLGEVTSIKESVAALEEDVKGLKRTDDEKIGERMSPRYGLPGGVRPSEAADNVVDEKVAKEMVKEQQAASPDDENPALKYVNDLLGNTARIQQG